ncbi:MAG: ribonuclease III [Helicobacteraceae bacterium]
MCAPELEKILGYEFKSKELLSVALTHKSQLGRQNNERLEFLGDAVLDLVITDHIFSVFENASEGELSRLRSSLVNEDVLSRFARKISMPEFVKLSKAESKNNGKNKNSILANALEAIIGAIYLDAGLDAARAVILHLLQDEFPVLDPKELFKDYKTLLQEATQKIYKHLPTYKIVKETGPDHDKLYEAQVFINGESLAMAVGKTKKQAEQMAAKLAIETLGRP